MSPSSTLVSVVIPVYNVEAYLLQCLESVAAQSYRNLEIICVIDGSTDGSAEIVRQFALREPRCRFLTQTNQGLSAARNTGVAVAVGRWVFFLDSDDWMPEHALQALVSAAQGVGKAAVSGAVQEYWEDTSVSKPYKRPEKRRTGAIHLHRQDFFALETMAWNKLYHREWVSECLFAPGLVHEDLDFYWRYFSLHPEVYAIPETVIHYRRRPGTLSRQKDLDQHYQDHYIHIVDSAFAAARTHPSLRYHARRQALKYLRYLNEKNAPCERYLDHIHARYGVRDTAIYRCGIKLKKLLRI